MIRLCKNLFFLIVPLLLIGCKNREQGGVKNQESKKTLNGIQKSFHSNGNVKTVANFVNDTLNGELTTYYDDGGLHRKQFYNKGIRLGSALELNRDSSLKRFDYFDSLGSLKYTRTYDSLNCAYVEQGNAIGEIFFSDDTCEVGDTLELYFYLAIPPDCDVSFEVTTKSNSGTVLDRRDKTSISIDRFDYLFIVPRVERFSVEGILKLQSRIDKKKVAHYAGHSVVVIN